MVNDFAAPYEEIRHNKFAVMCATSGGGHLSWYEMNGERWFAKAAAAWLNKMANDVDFVALRQSKESLKLQNGANRLVEGARAEYNPLPRRLDDRAAIVS